MRELGIRWTLGDISWRGFLALQLSIWGAWRLFGRRARYAVCVNNLDLEDARARVGPVPAPVEWVDANGLFPEVLRPYITESVAEDWAWKFAPFSLFQDCKELALDSECILWSMPSALQAWVDDKSPSVLLAEHVKTGLGSLEGGCGGALRSSGMRGVPAHFDLEDALLALLRLDPARLRRELDEHGLAVAALARGRVVHSVPLADVSLASPFPPDVPRLGSCGAHFVGLNVKSFPWSLDGRPAQAYIADLWEQHVEALRQHVWGDDSPRDLWNVA